MRTASCSVVLVLGLCVVYLIWFQLHSTWSWQHHTPLSVEQVEAAAVHDPGYDRRGPSPQYLAEVSDEGMRRHKRGVDEYVGSEGFKRRVRLISLKEPRGILMNAGGRKYLPSLIVNLKVLREEVKCTLPVEVAWDSEEGLDPDTVLALNKRFGPVHALYLDSKPYPPHHRQVQPSKYSAKVYSLLHTRFREVLLLDADMTPLLDPTALFDEPQYRRAGNLFWPDLWDDWVKREVYPMVGLEEGKFKDALHTARGWLQHDCESGAFLLDRQRHADMLEYLWFINSHMDRLHPPEGWLLWGDKDTYPLAFGLAGKAHIFQQVSVPPGLTARWEEGVLKHAETGKRHDGWVLTGQLQYNSRAQAAFWHRNALKWDFARGQDNMPGLLSGPLPRWWTKYYMDPVPFSTIKHHHFGFAFTEDSVQKQRLPSQPAPPAPVTVYRWQDDATLQGETLAVDIGCEEQPLLSWYVLQARLALPVQAPPAMLVGCVGQLEAFLRNGTAAPSQKLRGGWQQLAAELEASRMTFITKNHLPGIRAVEKQGGGKAVPMLVPDSTMHSPQLAAMRAAFAAAAWLAQHEKRFPALWVAD